MKKSFANKIKRPLALCMAIIILTLCGCAGNQQNADSALLAKHAEELPDFAAGRKTGSHDRTDKHESHIE